MILISYWDLATLSVLVMILGVLLWLNGFDRVKQFWWANLRMVLQLLLMGVWLSWVFYADHWIWMALVAVVMLSAAGYEITKRQQYRFTRWSGLMIGILSLSFTALLLLVGVLTLVIQPDPWYQPQYAIPLLGMLLGNSMTAIGLGLDNMTRNSVQLKAKIEAQLALGFNARQSMEFIKQQSLHAAMIPILNMLVAAGIISLPGMMTGQILAGADPMEAVKYQIMVMLLIASSTSLGTLIAVHLTLKRLFDERLRLDLQQLSKR
ncbi:MULTISPECIES: ABC transporter permease [Thiomicrorhabdus]|uniref:Iron export ABC transporter permease subunit FetB n=1 Tax=Thiomicrorhabdus heinhorstiae TaxID=2748010 RepID=A0ABS0BYG8_9GAMM|nr:MULTISPECIES: iron export ABC transporter permease subunit FetB [Thiomicrorhabdus]MBF6058842.1 iron export ABC transporter permease subunit FetB [Thiomicrorhabdus heinhorstiae]